MWVLTVEVLGLACLPLLRAFFADRRDAALLSRPVGLALVAGGRSRIGTRLSGAAPVHAERTELELVSPHMVDAENLRVRA